VKRTVAMSLLIALAVWGSGADAAQARYSAAELYNAGNAYARDGKLGLATLSYERARLLEPRNSDLLANLDTVRQAAHIEPPTGGLEHRLPTLANGAILLLGIAALALICTGMLLGLAVLPRALLAVTGTVLLGFAALCAWPQWRLAHAAVVVAPASAREAPVSVGEPLFALREAEVVHISDELTSFVLIRTAAGQTGWVDRSSVEPVLPRPR
jgi:hypothetical protein